VGQPERGLRVDKVGALPEHLLQRISRIQRPSCLDQQPSQTVAEIVKCGAQLQGPLILLYGPVQRARPSVCLGQVGVAIGKLSRYRQRQAIGGLAVHARCRVVERFLRLIGSAQLIEHQSTMNQGLDVIGIELQCAFQLLQGALGLSQERERNPEEMVHVGKCPAGIDHGFEQVDGAVIILNYESLSGPRQQEISLPGHKPP